MANPDETLVKLDTHTGLVNGAGPIARLNSVSVYLNKALALVAGGSLLLMILLVVGNIISRRVYLPFAGTTEAVGWLGAITVAFGLGFTQLQQGFVEIDALVEKFPLSLQKVIKSLVLFLSIGFYSLVAWQLCRYGLTTARNGNLSETMSIIYYPLIYLVALGFGGLVLALLVDFLKEITGRSSQ